MLTLYLCVLSLFLSQSECGQQKRLSELEKIVLEDILSEEKYDGRVRPNALNHTGGPTVVTVNTFIRALHKLDEDKEEFGLQIVFRQEWEDDRLRFDNQNGKIQYITLTDPSLLWLPDIFFANEKKAHLHEVMQPNVLIRVYPDGKILYSRRVSLVLECHLHLKKFPFDRQECNMNLASYAWTTNDVILKWKDQNPVEMSKNLKLNVFNLEKFISYHFDRKTLTGTYDVLVVSFYFSREFHNYLRTIFIPLSMFVVLSWLQFWVRKSALESRVLVGLGALVTAALFVACQNSSLPKVSYNRLIDTFSGICLTLIFGALVETILVHYLFDKEEEVEPTSHLVNGDVDKKTDEGKINRVKKLFEKVCGKSNCADAASRLLFPLVFAFLWISVVICATESNSGDGIKKDATIVYYK